LFGVIHLWFCRTLELMLGFVSTPGFSVQFWLVKAPREWLVASPFQDEVVDLVDAWQMRGY
jgi:hypothetical protein